MPFITDPINSLMKAYGGPSDAKQTFNHASIRSGVPPVTGNGSDWYALYYSANGTYMGWSSVAVSRKVAKNAKEAGFYSYPARWGGYVINDPKQLQKEKGTVEDRAKVVMHILHRQIDLCDIPTSDKNYRKELLNNVMKHGVPHTAYCYDPRGLLADLAKKEEAESQALVKKYKELAKKLIGK